MHVKNLYLAQVQVNINGQVSVELRLVWAQSEGGAIGEVWSLYENEETKPIGEILDVTVTPAIGRMVR